VKAKPNVREMSDADGVDLFAKAMKRRMARAARNGRSGWNNPERLSPEYLVGLLLDEITVDNGKPNPVDIANYAMMIYHRGTAGRLALNEACANLRAEMEMD
jgi:hypothetical protein